MSLIREVTPSGVLSYGNNTQPAAPSPASNPMVSDPQIDEMAIAQVLGVDPKEMSQYSDNLQTLRLWASKQGYKDTMELKWIMRTLQDKLGSPALSEKWITVASRYAYLQMEEDRARQERMDLVR